MPNNIRNRLTILAMGDRLAEIKDFVAGERIPFQLRPQSLFDFNTIVPRPNSIIRVGTPAIDIIYAAQHACHAPLSKSVDAAMREEVQRLEAWMRVVADKENEPQLEAACKAYHETGYFYWFDWSIANWGTKWSAYDFNENTPDDVIEFSTAWSCVLELIKKLSNIFLFTEFLYEWADENIGYNCGKAKISEGVAWVHTPEDNTTAAYDLGFSLWPDQKEYFVFDDGVFKPVED